MKQTDISTLITARLNYYGYGKGNSYVTYLNGNRLWSGIAELRKTAKEGDHVHIKAYTIRGSWYKGEFSFRIKADDQLLEAEKIYLAKRKEAPKRKYRDSQKQRVYNWERIAVGKHDRLSYAEIVKLVDSIHSDYGVNSPKVILSKKQKNRATYTPMFHEITLPIGWGQRKDTVLHEVAHSLIHSFNWNVISRGREFVALVAELYEKYMGVSKQQTLGQADRFKLKVDYNFKVDCNCGK